MSPKRCPTETSPLLGSPSNGNSSQPPSRGPVPRGSESNAAQSKNAAEARNKLAYIIPAVSIGIFLSAADQTIIMASYSQIGSDLQALNLTSWIATSYFLTLTSFQPLYGKLSDIFGRKACLLWAYTIFGTGCLFCGLANNIHQLIAARAFQGIGGGGMTAVVSILMSDIIPLRDRGLWQGVTNIIYTTGSGTGAPLGGVLADYISWRWAFIAQVPLCVIAFTAVSFMLDLPSQEDSHWKAKLRRIDFPGAIILVGAVFGLLLGLDRGSNISWSLPITIISLSISAALFILFVVVEIYYAREPFAPGYIISNSSFFTAYSCNFFSFGGQIAGLFYIPLYFQAVDDISATVSGLRLLPSILCGVSGSLFAGFMMKWTGRFYWLAVIAYAFLTLGMALIFLFSGVIENLVGIILGTMAASFGNSIGVTTTLITLISNSTPDDQAVVTACSYLFRSLGSVIGLSLSSTLVQQVLRSRLRYALHDSKDIDRIVNGVRESLDFIKTLDPAVGRIVRSCYASAINKGFAFLVGTVFFALVSSFFIREKQLTR